MKNVYIVHRWEGTPESDWYQGLATELRDLFKVHVLPMPNPDEPVIQEWVEFLEKNILSLTEDTYFVGHSIGCQAILRFLAAQTKTVGKVALVAPWTTLSPAATEGVEGIAEPWLQTPIDWLSVRIKAEQFMCLFSDNDPYVPIENCHVFQNNLDAKISILKSKGHFTEDDGVTQLPELSAFIGNLVI